MKARRWFSRVLVVALVAVLFGICPFEQMLMKGAYGVDTQVLALQNGEDGPVVNPNAAWKANAVEQVSACDNRPGLKMFYVTVLDDRGEPLRGVVVRFDTAPSEGIAYDHKNIWGYTNCSGYIEWEHLGIPTRYQLWMEDDQVPLIENIRTDLGNGYCKPPGGPAWSGNVPVNRPGIYSYRIEIQRK